MFGWRRAGGAPARVWTLLLLPLVLLAALTLLTGEGRGRFSSLVLLLPGVWFLRWPRASLQRAMAPALLLLLVAMLAEMAVARATFWDLSYLDFTLDPWRIESLLRGRDNLPPHVREGESQYGRSFEVEGATWPIRVTAEGRARGEPVAVKLSAAGMQAYDQLWTGWSETWRLASEEWALGEWEFNDPGHAQWLWAITVPAGAQVHVRAFSAVDAAGVTLPPSPMPTRASIWFSNPNSLGHALAAFGALAMALSGRFLPALLWGALGFVAIGLTGSRTAALALVVGGSWLLASHVPRRWRLPLAALVVLVAVAAVGLQGDALGRLGAWSWQEENVQTRLAQMSVAWEAMLAHPLSGSVLPSGAHNFWLDYAGMLGVPGLLAALWLTLGILYLAWRVRSARAFGVVITVLVLQLTDNSLVHFGVLMPAMLALQTFAPVGTPLTPLAAPVPVAGETP